MLQDEYLQIYVPTVHIPAPCHNGSCCLYFQGFHATIDDKVVCHAVMPQLMKVPESTSTGRLASVRDVPVIPALAGFYFDFIMRCHITQWKAPGGHHCGGWCRCKIRQDVTIRGKVGTTDTHALPLAHLQVVAMHVHAMSSA
jgi:hypothetical protein